MSIRELLKSGEFDGTDLIKRREMLERLSNLGFLNGMESFSMSDKVHEIITSQDSGIPLLDPYQKNLLYNLFGSEDKLKEFFEGSAYRINFFGCLLHGRCSAIFFACTMREYFALVMDFVESQSQDNVSKDLSLYVEIMAGLESKPCVVIDHIKKETQKSQDNCSDNEKHNFDVLSGKKHGYVLIRVSGVIVGHVKLSGEDTFLSYHITCNPSGKLQLVLGGIYTISNWDDITRPKYQFLDRKTYIYDVEELDINFLRISNLRSDDMGKLIKNFLQGALGKEQESANYLITHEKKRKLHPEESGYYDL